MKKKLSGIFAPITTPFVNEDVSLEHLKANMLKYRNTGLAGFFALGSNGENKSLAEDEKLKVLEVVLHEKAERQLLMAGTGYESTRQTIAFSKKVAEMGADFVSVVTPSYFKKRLTDEAMTGYYIDIADAVSVPVLAYNAPGFTGMTLSAKVVEKISQHPNIVGMKDTSAGNMSSYLDVCSDDFDILAGTISTLFTAMSLGASGGVVSLANAFPNPCCELYEKFNSGDLVGARQLHFRLFRLNRSVSGSFGVAGVKYAMEVGGYYGGDPRLPLLPLSDDNKKDICNAVAKAGL
ncbi:MAG: dihydrodipicolinate synthase family protein [Desulfobacterales bacterium]|nr:MAG: dihydrodipicolinate synthase family protein [Desulfobacterales bacterium]